MRTQIINTSLPVDHWLKFQDTINQYISASRQPGKRLATIITTYVRQLGENLATIIRTCIRPLGENLAIIIRTCIRPLG